MQALTYSFKIAKTYLAECITKKAFLSVLVYLTVGFFYIRGSTSIPSKCLAFKQSKKVLSLCMQYLTTFCSRRKKKSDETGVALGNNFLTQTLWGRAGTNPPPDMQENSFAKENFIILRSPEESTLAMRRKKNKRDIIQDLSFESYDSNTFEVVGEEKSVDLSYENIEDYVENILGLLAGGETVVQKEGEKEVVWKQLCSAERTDLVQSISSSKIKDYLRNGGEIALGIYMYLSVSQLTVVAKIIKERKQIT